MAEVKLVDINRTLEEFNKLAEKFKVSKKDVTDELPQLREAVALFSRLQELYQSVDPDSPRAKNYFSLAQSIASINQGWQNTQALIQREASLADHEVSRGQEVDRLSSEEVEHLKTLINSSKLKNFVQFLDMENPEAFATLKDVVQFEDRFKSEGAESPLTLERFNQYKTEWDISVQREVERDNEILSVGNYLSEKIAELFQTVLGIDDKMEQNTPDEFQDYESESSEDQNEPDSDNPLSEFEKERQDSQEDREVKDEILKTTASIDEALRESSQTTKRQEVSRDKGRDKKNNTPSFMSDLKDVLKWLSVGAAVFAGIGFIAKALKDYLSGASKSKDEIISAIKDFESERKETEQQRLNEVADADEAGKRYKSYLAFVQSAQEKGLMPESISAEDINLIHGLMLRGDVTKKNLSSKIAEFLDLRGTKYSSETIALIRALLTKSNVAYVDRNASSTGVARAFQIDPMVGNIEEINSAAGWSRGVHFNRELESIYPFLKQKSDDRWIDYAAPAFLAPFAAPLLGYMYSDPNKIGNSPLKRLLSPIRGMSPSKFMSMSPQDREQYLLENYSNELLETAFGAPETFDPETHLFTNGVLNPQNPIPVVEGSLIPSDRAIAEIIASQSNTKYPRLRDAQASGDEKQMYEAFKSYGIKVVPGYSNKPMETFEDYKKSGLLDASLRTGDFGSGATPDAIAKYERDHYDLLKKEAPTSPPVVNHITNTTVTTYDLSNQQMGPNES